jgi:hypothetical protein
MPIQHFINFRPAIHWLLNVFKRMSNTNVMFGWFELGLVSDAHAQKIIGNGVMIIQFTNSRNRHVGIIEYRKV